MRGKSQSNRVIEATTDHSYHVGRKSILSCYSMAAVRVVSAGGLLFLRLLPRRRVLIMRLRHSSIWLRIHSQDENKTLWARFLGAESVGGDLTMTECIPVTGRRTESCVYDLDMLSI